MLKSAWAKIRIAAAQRAIQNSHSTVLVIQQVQRLHSGITGLLGMQPRSSTVTHTAPRKTSAYGMHDKGSMRALLIGAPSRHGILRSFESNGTCQLVCS
jgi:hypothetical protein